MALQFQLPSGESVLIENDDDQTQLTFQSGGPNQQQSQRSGFTTGAWTHPPTLFQLDTGLILRIEADKNHYLALAGRGVRHLDSVPELSDAIALPLEQSQAATTHPAPPQKLMEPMKPMRPLEPMKPMEMRLGSMQMSMGGPRETAPQPPTTPATSSEAPTGAFCTQCGERSKESDKFCARCGHELRSL